MGNTDITERLALIEAALFPPPPPAPDGCDCEYCEELFSCEDLECGCEDDGSVEDLAEALSNAVLDGVFSSVERLSFIAEHGQSETAAVSASSALIGLWVALVDRA